MKNVLQIPSDVGAYCREAAKVLESSARFLTREIDMCRDPADASDADGFTVFMESDEVARTRDNVRRAAQWLDWLAQHGVHSRPVERVEAAHERD